NQLGRNVQSAGYDYAAEIDATHPGNCFISKSMAETTQVIELGPTQIQDSARVQEDSVSRQRQPEFLDTCRGNRVFETIQPPHQLETQCSGSGLVQIADGDWLWCRGVYSHHSFLYWIEEGTLVRRAQPPYSR